MHYTRNAWHLASASRTSSLEGLWEALDQSQQRRCRSVCHAVISSVRKQGLQHQSHTRAQALGDLCTACTCQALAQGEMKGEGPASAVSRACNGAQGS